MLFSIASVVTASAGIAAAIPTNRDDRISVTPHEQYSSSIGALGCYLNTNRVAYWPETITCDNICVKVTNGDRSVNLLRVDQSGGAHDISYDAWNYLAYGESATLDPHEGGGVAMTYEQVDGNECKPLLKDGKLALSASNSMNFYASCLGSENWVAKNSELVNIDDPLCKYGYDEICSLDLHISNQPSCSHALGSHSPTDDLAVTNIAYGTGKEYTAQ
ncbi:cerato-platanin [Purpureocillium lilacinum]|uniref:Cerato-platanin n=1 Tax=Purpureocillium lilacinum TaxID=33203 RepID=A0A179FEP2_PURLI|nr:cerato-platanin [Purpureocillium lilacinum]